MQFAKWPLRHGHMRSGQAVVVTAAVAVVTVVVTVGAQSNRPPEPDVLNALLMEVRGLRTVMEQMASAGPRVQLALGRLQLQEQRVSTMVRRLDSVRDAIAKVEKDTTAAQAQLAMMGKTFQGDNTPPEGNPFAEMVKGLQQTVAGGVADVQRLQSEEALLQQQIAEEQGRWSEINRTLEELERALMKR